MNRVYKLVVKKPISLMEALISLFSDGAAISFEGKLSSSLFLGIPDALTEPVEPFKRYTISPKQDYAIVPITTLTSEILRKRILPQIGLRKNVEHVHIVKDGEIVFYSYDCFDKDCVGLAPKIDEDKLRKLKDEGVLKDYKLIEY